MFPVAELYPVAALGYSLVYLLAGGGLGGAIAEVLAQQHPTPMRILGVPDVFAPTGKAEFLLEHFGLTAAGIERAALELLAREG